MAKRRDKAQLVVEGRHGRYRFQTGMITASLLQKGIPMAQAFPLARELRERLSGRKSISTDELEEMLHELVFERTGGELDVEDPPTSEGMRPGLRVRTATGTLPFSRGMLLPSLIAVGMRADPAFELLAELERWLHDRGQPEVEDARVRQWIGRRLLQYEGRRYAARYGLLEWVANRSRRKPLVVFIGGATGTGKSTLAMELAFRLGIRRVIGTDIVREAMRSVVVSELVPGLHDHSFRGVLQGGGALSDPRERVLAGFAQQAAQVSLGVRGAVARAVREGTDCIVEGTHLRPPFHDVAGDPNNASHVGLVLGLPLEARHFARFPKRRATSQREPSAYLDAFQSVRWIHDSLLEAAEEAECLVLGEGGEGDTVLAALDFLSQVLDVDAPTAQSPAPARSAREQPHTLTIIIDGLSEGPVPELGGKSPLQAAHTPVLNALAASGAQGQLSPAVGRDGTPHTNSAVGALLGLPTDLALGRGLCEAIGAGLELTPGAIVFRGNVAHIAPDGTVLDRRAGRPRGGLDPLFEGLEEVPLRGGLVGSVRRIHEHRLGVAISGPGLSDLVSNTDPGDRGAQQIYLPPRALDHSPEAARTAEALAELLAKAGRHLANHPFNTARVAAGKIPITGVLTRGAARVDMRHTGQSTLGNAAVVAGCRTTLGLARLGGLRTVTAPEMTANLDTDLDLKFTSATALLESWTHVVVHIKGTDIAAHDCKPLAKSEFMAAIDAALGRCLRAQARPLRVVVTADHGTSSITGAHLPDPVPVLLGVWPTEGEPGEWNELSAEHGALGHITVDELLEIMRGKVPTA